MSQLFKGIYRPAKDSTRCHETLERPALWNGCCIHTLVLVTHNHCIINKSLEGAATQERAPKPESLQGSRIGEVPSTSIHNRVSGNHTDASIAAHRRLSIPQTGASRNLFVELSLRVSSSRLATRSFVCHGEKPTCNLLNRIAFI